MKNDTIREELKRIADENGGILKPETVIEEARKNTSPLHDQFTWDDTEAAQQYRLWEARQLIRCTVIYEPQTETTIRAFVSLTPDRDEDGGGYRETVRVLSNKGMREQMLSDALEELDTFEKKYKCLKELADVFNAARKVRTNKKGVTNE